MISPGAEKLRSSLIFCTVGYSTFSGGACLVSYAGGAYLGYSFGYCLISFVSSCLSVSTFFATSTPDPSERSISPLTDSMSSAKLSSSLISYKSPSSSRCFPLFHPVIDIALSLFDLT